MPFTLAHSAAALPFRHLRLVPSALIVGTVAPDFEYFIRLAPSSGFGHSLLGTFVLTFPLAIVVLWIFHAFVKRTVVSLLPDQVQNCLANQVKDFRFGGTARFGVIVASILLGIATHVFWDSFTHRNTWPYRHWVALRENIQLYIVGSMPLYKVLQHVSTALGITVLAIWILSWYRIASLNAQPVAHSVTHRRRLLVVSVVAIFALVGGALRVFLATHFIAGEFAPRRSLVLFVVTVIALAWWQLVAYGVLVSEAIGRPRS